MVEVALGESAHFKNHADALRIPFETVKSWKRRRKVPLYELETFSERYGVTIDWLLHGDQPKVEQDKPHQVQPDGLSADEAALLETYRGIDPEARVTLRNMLKVIATAGQAKVQEKKPKLRQPRHAGAVEPVSRRSADSPSKKPGRARGSGGNAQ